VFFMANCGVQFNAARSEHELSQHEINGLYSKEHIWHVAPVRLPPAGRQAKEVRSWMLPGGDDVEARGGLG
jgi:hypothetical protein